MPPRKRLASSALADDTGTVDARIRRHLAAMMASHAAILSLLDQLNPPVATAEPSGIFIPDDIVRHILEFVIGRRRCAQFGVDGVLRPASFSDFESDVASLRLINKQWARIGGELIRSLLMPAALHCKPTALVKAFPNTSRLTMNRCVVDSKTTNALSAVIKLFYDRPKHLFIVNVDYCSSIGKPTLDCHGMLAKVARRFRACPNGCNFTWSDGHFKLINTIFMNNPAVYTRPDEIFINCPMPDPDSVAAMLDHPMNVEVTIETFSRPPRCSIAAFRAMELRIIGNWTTWPAPQSKVYLAEWLSPRLWHNEQRPVVTWIVDTPAKRAIAESVVQALVEQTAISISIIDNIDPSTADAGDDDVEM